MTEAVTAPHSLSFVTKDIIVDLLAEFTGGKVEFFAAGRYHGHNDYTITMSSDKPQPDFAKYGLRAESANGGLGKNETLYFINADQEGFAENLAKAVTAKRGVENGASLANKILSQVIESELKSRNKNNARGE